MESEINIKVIDREGVSHNYVIPDGIGISLMEWCKANELPVLATCGGMALCATCHVYVLTDNELSAPTDDEEAMLDQVPDYQSNSRLACQIPIDQKCRGLIVQLAPE